MIFKHASFLIAPFFLASLVSAQTVDSSVCRNGNGGDNRCNRPGLRPSISPLCIYDEYCKIDGEFTFTDPGVPSYFLPRDNSNGLCENFNCPPNCRPGQPGATKSITVNVQGDYKAGFKLTVEASGGINVGWFDQEFKVGVGFNKERTISVSQIVSTTTPYCTYDVSTARFTYDRNKKARVTGEVIKVTTTSGWFCDQDGWESSCYTGSALATFDGTSWTAQTVSLRGGACE